MQFKWIHQAVAFVFLALVMQILKALQNEQYLRWFMRVPAIIIYAPLARSYWEIIMTIYWQY